MAEMETSILEACLTWHRGGFQTGLQVEVLPDGRIGRIGLGLGAATRRFPAGALLPGLINAHSHAFQIGLRGRVERFAPWGAATPSAAGSGADRAGGPTGKAVEDFWTWRGEMYALVESMTPERLYELSLRAFREMLAGGITTVGEFHYLHQLDEGFDYLLDDAVLSAARDSGIRTRFLEAYYARGGFGRPLSPAQRRFASPDPATYWKQMDRLAGSLDGSLLSLGAVVHSVRAANWGELREIYDEAARRALPFHIHVEEQPAEIEDSLRDSGRRPMEWIVSELAVGPRMTAIHCTHTRPEDMARYLRMGGNVCLCPSTEANLGDGFCGVLEDVLAVPERLSLGSDQGGRLCFFEEMRWLEYGQRLLHRRRGVLADGGGRVALRLFEAATAGGARALDLPIGRIESGRHADFCVIDLAAPILADRTPEDLLERMVFCGGPSLIADRCVGGKWLT